MYLRGTYTKEHQEQDLVPWVMLQKQLALDDDTYKELAESFAQAEVHNAEIYTNRALIAGEVTVYYDAKNICVEGLYLPMPPETTPELTITIDDVELEETDYTFIPEGTGKIIFTAAKTTAKNIKIVYTPEVYARRKSLLPGILMKVTQYFTKRENDSESRGIDPALSIYSRHRIKTSF